MIVVIILTFVFIKIIGSSSDVIMLQLDQHFCCYLEPPPETSWDQTSKRHFIGFTATAAPSEQPSNGIFGYHIIMIIVSNIMISITKTWVR